MPQHFPLPFGHTGLSRRPVQFRRLDLGDLVPKQIELLFARGLRRIKCGMPANAPSNQSQVADDIENLVAYEFIGKPQWFLA